MLESSIGKGKIAKPSIQCNFEGVKSPNVPVVTEVFKYGEDDEEFFKKLNAPWLSEVTSSFQDEKCIDSENENIWKSVK